MALNIHTRPIRISDILLDDNEKDRYAFFCKFCALLQFTMRRLSGTDHIKYVVQLCPLAGQHSIHRTSHLFDYPQTTGSNIIHRCSLKYNRSHMPYEERSGRDNRGA